MSRSKGKLEKTPTLTGSSDDFSSIPIDQEIEEEIVDTSDIELLQRMDIAEIEELRKYFFDEKKFDNSNLKQINDYQIYGLNLNLKEFVEAFEKIFGAPTVCPAATKLFESLDGGKNGLVRWENVLDALIAVTNGVLERETEGWEPVESNVNIYHASHCKRENIVKIVPLYTKLTFCYAVISKLGRVGVYDGEFNLLDTYKIGLKPTTGKEYLTAEQEERQRRSKTTWVTDSVFVPDTYALFFSASDRSLHLYDATGLIHVPLCLVSGFKNIPTCMDYYSSIDPGNPSLLFIGDDQGDVTMMQFHQPKKSLFRKKDPDKLDKYLWSELKEQTEYVTHITQSKIHDDEIIQISYNPESKTVLTCSNDPVKTMIFRHIEKRRKAYVFKVPRGIKCFHLDKSLQIIVTGSKDCLVRVWNQVVTKQPIVSLHGHKEPVVDVRILKHILSVISLSEKGIVKIWDLNDYYCLTTLQLNFPVFKILGSRIYYGTRSIFPGPNMNNIFEELSLINSKDASKVTSFSEEIETWLSTRDFEIKEEEEWSRNSVVVICCNYIALLKLTPRPSYSDEAGMPELLKKYKILPPPAREHYASVPTPWKIIDSFTKTPPEESDDASTAKSSSSSSTTKNMPISKAFHKIHGATSDPVKAPMMDMNTKRTKYKIKQEQMKMLVQNCAPHMALDLYDLAPIKFSRPLPKTKEMIEKGIDVSDPEQLIKGKFFKDSTITTGETLSDLLSPRSSKNSKLLSESKKKISPTKGRQTPDWLSSKIKSLMSDSSETDSK